ncbi:energy-coupling factor ABC transporter ATP-binding protein [Leptolyngbya sp. NIES-2104]|uniref:energy-coupling factor ABC transporter ATP-binding protein n=1 Tax=Leptolyngbya sp. NIES-2104 TaxID=1552121 RepID=UPI0006EC4D1A|nr:ATP-binding cassette domain-containing protein [Leptolyngbya sp. NIES-2104]GAP97747.1 ATPase component NikO of energizing module of nickel ECF transporter [Leptolyngbya sp. NIES-2104]
MHHNPIEIYNLSYSYPDGTQALNGMTVSVRATERVAIVGANGSGKSTLLMHFNGLITPQVGQVIVGEYPVETQYLKQIRDFVGIVFQNPDDQLFMPTVWEDITFGPLNQSVTGQALIDRCVHAMRCVGLDPEAYGPRSANGLSGGEKKRVAIAGVLAMQPQVLVLDEPSAQLDPRSRRQLIELLDTLPLTQLIATHDLDLALELCSRTIVLSKGEIVFDGATERIMSDPELLTEHALEPPLSYSRPYCQIEDA